MEKTTEPSRGSFHLRVIIPQVNKVQKMFKSVIAALAAAPLFAGAALART